MGERIASDCVSIASVAIASGAIEIKYTEYSREQILAAAERLELPARTSRQEAARRREGAAELRDFVESVDAIGAALAAMEASERAFSEGRHE